ncbi:putative F-box/FBD/LRR-repeat protein At5g62970 [Chenopodium quinoa]|uniref:putative F-box/FBD/LRR-repeat protein At5g62970 n=1 Tax=Chenopodium quinoa TaxID=63459 RepID=UPI000B782E50|nr:putative F-box/FBD/LRR-repeat protein At5g62970 [Chenopodium quinoa]XP_021760038.1 putative F-box/FBD/LRR-repeat protein At5g62970 [Chenopodium quinoa]
MCLRKYVPKLNFEDSRAMKRIKVSMSKDEIVDWERCCFISFVNRVLEQSLGDIDEMRIKFDLDNLCKFDIDKWVNFATARELNKLELDFFPALLIYRRRPGNKSFLPPKYLYTVDFKPTLKSLHLNYVNVSNETVTLLLDSCQLLENLWLEFSEILTSVTSASLSLPLKHLTVLYCFKMQTIDVSAPKLLSLTYFGDPIEFNIRSASSFLELSVGGDRHVKVAYAFEPLAIYLSQLKYLQLRMRFIHGNNLAIEHSPAFPDLKHLELYVLADFNESLLGWIPLIKACPILQKLTLKLEGSGQPSWEFHKREGCPLRCLKTLEVFGYYGSRLDDELITYVLANSVILSEVILDVTSLWSMELNEDAAIRARKLGDKVPNGAKLVIKRSSSEEIWSLIT